MPRGFAEMAEALRHLQAQTRCDAIEVVLVHTPAHAADDRPGAFTRFRRFVAVAGRTHSHRRQRVRRGARRRHRRRHRAGRRSRPAGSGLGGRGAGGARDVRRRPWRRAWRTRIRPPRPVGRTSSRRSPRRHRRRDPPGPSTCGPGHNTSYKAAVLRQYRGELLTLYQSERMFHYRLRAGRARDPARAARAAGAPQYLGAPRGHGPRVARRRSCLARTAARAMGVVREGGEDGAGAAGAAAAPVADVAHVVGAPQTCTMPATAWVLLPVLLISHAAGEAVGYWNLRAATSRRSTSTSSCTASSACGPTSGL